MGRVYNGKCACCGKWSSNPVGPFKGCPLGKKIPVPCYVRLPNYRPISHNRLCGTCFLYHTLNAPVEEISGERRRCANFSHIANTTWPDRHSVVQGKRVSGRVDLVGRRNI